MHMCKIKNFSPMNYLKKKICISMYLDELFEDVDEDKESYGREDVKNGHNPAKEVNTEIERSRFLLEQKKFISNTIRSRKYRNAYILSHEEQIPCEEPLEKLHIEEIQLQQQQQLVKSMSSISQDDTRYCYSDSINDYDVEEYFDSDLEESCTQANGDCRTGRKTSKEELIQGLSKEKRAVTSILVSLKNDKKPQQRVQRTVTEGSAQTEPTCETVKTINVQIAERTHKNLQTSRKLTSETKTDREMQMNYTINPVPPSRYTKQEEVFKEKNSNASIGKHRENQNEDTALAAKCAASIGLSRDKNKSTQTDSGILPDSNYICKPWATSFKSASEYREEKKRDEKLSLFNNIYSRKPMSEGKCMTRITNTSSMSNIYKSSKFICSRVLSETKFNSQRETAILWQNHKMKRWMMCKAESGSLGYSDTNILKKGYCDVIVKTFMNANKPQFMCYSLSIPWEITTFGEFVIPKNTLRMNKILSRGTKYPANGHVIFTESSDDFDSHIKSHASRELTELVNGQRLVDADSSSLIKGEDVNRRLITEKNTSSGCMNVKMENENGTKHVGGENILNCRKITMETTEVVKSMSEYLQKTEEMPLVIEDRSSRRSVNLNSGCTFTLEGSENKKNAKHVLGKENESNSNRQIEMETIQVSKNVSKYFQKHEAIDVSTDMTTLQKYDLWEKLTCEKAINTDITPKENENVTVEWELQVEIENVGDTNPINAKEEEERRGGHDMKQISSMNLVLVCDKNLTMGQELTPLDFFEVEECILKDEKTEKTCKAILPRDFINKLEKKLKKTRRD